jgi:hypothetical protein
LGGPQDYPTIIHPEDSDWDLSVVHNASDLYGLFAKQRALTAGASRNTGEST